MGEVNGAGAVARTVVVSGTTRVWRLVMEATRSPEGKAIQVQVERLRAELDALNRIAMLPAKHT
jgi:hypothetical protein